MAAQRAARHRRVQKLGYDPATQPSARVTTCNLCGSTVFTRVTHVDRYGYRAPASGCQRCGLVFLNPLLTAEAYARFYVDVYRPLVSAYHDRLIDAHTMQDEQREYAETRGDFLAPHLTRTRHQTLLDIGGSTGVVAHALCQRFGLRGTVVDPSPLEIEEARLLGLATVTGLVEHWDAAGQTFDVVVLCQTADHLLDVSGTLRAVRERIAADGVLFVDIVDFRAACLRGWSVEDAVKIDHPYSLTQPTIEAFLQRAGFEVLEADFAADHLHVGYVCRPMAPQSEALPTAAQVDELWRELRYVQNAPVTR